MNEAAIERHYQTKKHHDCAQICSQYRHHIDTITSLQLLIDLEEQKIKSCLEKMCEFCDEKKCIEY